MFLTHQGPRSTRPKRATFTRNYRPTLECLEDRCTPAPLTFAVIGDYGVGSTIYNTLNVLLGTPDAAGDVSRLVHSWNPEFLLTLGDNNYLVGEQFDANLLLDLQLGIAAGKIAPSTAQDILDALSQVPISGLITVVTAQTTAGSNVLTGLSSTSALSVGMAVYGAGLPFPTGPSAPFLATVTAINSSSSVTLSLDATSTVNNASLTFLPGNINLGLIDGLSHIDRTIGKYYSDFIYPYIASSPLGQFGNGSPTGFNRMFPVPGNHDWADIDSDGGASIIDKEVALAVGALEMLATLVTPGTLTVADASKLTVGMSVMGPGLPTIDPSNPLSILLLPRIESINGNTITLDQPLPTSLVPNSTLIFLPIFNAAGQIAPGNLDAYLNFFAGLNPVNSPGLKLGTIIVNGVETPLAQPYFYSFTVGQANGGRPLIEFFAFDSELANPYLTGAFVGNDFTTFTNVDTINSQQGQWLKRAMAASNAVWKIPYFHHTPYTSAGEGNEGAFTGLWMQLPFQQWGADAVLYGHVHLYERLSKADPAIPALNIPAGKRAIPYLLNGFGGAPPSPFYGPLDPGSKLRYNGDFGAQRVTADEHRITFEFINRSGAVIDKFTIAKPLVVAANNAGSKPIVRLVNAQTGAAILSIQAYEAAFTGGVRVATGDVNGDGMPDIITAPGKGRVGQVRVFDGLTGQALAGFTPFTPYGASYKNGLFVAAGNIDGQLGDEIIVGPQTGALPLMVFTRTGAPLPGFAPFFPYGDSFTGGFTVAAGNTNGAGVDEIITAPFKGARPVQVQDAAGALLLTTNPYGTSFNTGIFVATGDIDGDGRAEIITGPVSGKQPAKILSGTDGSLIRQIFPFGTSYQAGIRLGALDFNQDGLVDLLFGRGNGGTTTGLVMNPLTLEVFKRYGINTGFGLFVAGR